MNSDRPLLSKVIPPRSVCLKPLLNTFAAALNQITNQLHDFKALFIQPCLEINATCFWFSEPRFLRAIAPTARPVSSEGGSFEAKLRIDRTARDLEKQASWNQGLCPWEISDTALRQALREKLGLRKYVDPNREWTKYDVAADAEQARQLAVEIKIVLHLSITPQMSDVQIVHQLLNQMGLKVGFRWSRKVAGHEGEKLRVYRLKADCYSQAIAILERRAARREMQQLWSGELHGGRCSNSRRGARITRVFYLHTT